MAHAIINAATVVGVVAVPVTVEVHISSGLPSFKIVGMTDIAVQESRERVHSALKSSGYKIPQGRITVNLAPAPLKKRGTGFDLAIALGILAASAQIDQKGIDSEVIVGELSLTGHVRSVSGQVAYALLAKAQAKTLVGSQISQLSNLVNVPFRQIDTLLEYAGGAVGDPCPRQGASFSQYRTKTSQPIEHADSKTHSQPRAGLIEYQDIADIVGQEIAIRALTIAVTGRHNLLLIGPPGTGKTMLASRVPSIMPELTPEKSLETALIYSVSSRENEYRVGSVPFRSPHHSASLIGLIGGGNPPHCGEVSFAHNGVLFLDELTQFAPSALQALRTPLQDRSVTVVRADTFCTFPSDFLLIAAANPCPCGYFGDRFTKCTCTSAALSSYQARVGGPLMDRFDLVCWVRRIDPDGLLGKRKSKNTSKNIKELIVKAKSHHHLRTEAYGRPLGSEEFGKDQLLSASARALLLAGAKRLNLSPRAIMKTLRVAKTISDLDQSVLIEEPQILEALSYRSGWDK